MKPILFFVFLILSVNGFAEPSASLSATIYKKLIESQEQLEKNDYETSIGILKKLTERNSLSDYENGMVWHLLGYTYLEKGQLNKSVEALEHVLTFDIPMSLNLSNRQLLAQAYLQKNAYSKALPHLNFWLNSSDSDEKEEVHILTAQCYFQIKRYQSAVAQINLAIKSYEAKQQRPKEQWLTLLQSSLAFLDAAEDRLGTLKLLLTWYPKPEYWLALAGTYAQMEKMDNYLAVLALAQRKKLLTSEAQYLSLASVYFSEGIPYQAAKVIEEGFAKRIIPHNVKNLRFLASAYSMAREHEKAINPLKQAANQATDGQIHMLLGNAYYQLAQWQNASESFEIAIDKGGLNHPTTAWLMLGQTYLNLKRFKSAAAAFEQAALDEDKAEQAQKWLQYVAYEKDRHEALGLETH